MIVEKVIGTLKETDKDVEYVRMEWFERDKKLMRVTTDKGTEIGIRVSEPLNDGDILYEDADKIIAVDVKKCDLIKISVTDICEMGRLCFEIGNRHLSLSIKPDSVRIPYDEPTYEYLKKLGFNAQKVNEKFTDFTLCRGHTHEHHHEHHHDRAGEYPHHHHCDR